MGPGGFVPTTPDLPDILGRTHFHFENVYFFYFLDPKFPNFQVSDFQISRNLAWARLGPDLGLGSGVPLGWLPHSVFNTSSIVAVLEIYNMCLILCLCTREK